MSGWWLKLRSKVAGKFVANKRLRQKLQHWPAYNRMN